MEASFCRFQRNFFIYDYLAKRLKLKLTFLDQGEVQYKVNKALISYLGARKLLAAASNSCWCSEVMDSPDVSIVFCRL